LSNFSQEIKKKERFDIVLIGIPFDEKSCYLRGAAKGPAAIRAAADERAINWWTEMGINLEEDITLVDVGDVDVSGDFRDVFTRIEESIFSILEKEGIPLILGGDHSISYPILKAFSRKFKELDVLHFDAHPDFYEELYGDRFSHACPFKRIMEEGLATSLLQVGIRASTGEQRANASIYPVKVIEMKDLGKISHLKFSSPLYISLDFDAFDPAFAPGVSHQEPGGLTSREVIEIIHSLEAKIVGMDLVELNPDRDPSGITAALGVKIVKEIAGKVAMDKKMRNG